MQIFALIPVFFIPISALQIPPLLAPFYEPYLQANSLLISNETLTPNSHDLLRRDGGCPANYDSCSTLGAANGGACCTAGSVCTFDGGRNIACCPIGAKCTGQLSIATATTTAAGLTLGSATTTSPGGFIFGTTTTPSSTTPTTTGSASLVSNPYFPFPYIPTTYANSVACNSAFSACQANFAACTNDLVGDRFGVTVVAPGGGGVTVAPTATNLGSMSAASICSSLSQEACYGIQSSNCPPFGPATNGGFGVPTNAAPRPTLMAGMMAGLGLGIAGQML
ncbi:hypothetical protein M430DRAFT_58033 [Amorphotheca resinae ATCC 22711]|uniref:Uncharacterized protein n=1 Tax=Amorphotheca resinae ATCC 22711 TaxID=857342 RepID=A0A2T3B3F4_AMORE|nr:hypothetical protein M430DRAFT_58033 [Amorphotheca resinae ATCC 22711]PSS20151.1 hypothetical protein M430DRAFT_58033 [Amorphotheca resinae ATCC 22711]